MRHRYWRIWLAVSAAFVVLAIVYYYGVVKESEDKEPVVYSVILYQNADNEWSALMEGIEQAKKDYNVKVRYALSQENTAQEQIEDIKREIQSGASGILLAAADSEQVKEGLEEIPDSVPVFAVETGLGNGVCICADNYEMGQTLGRKILDDMESVREEEDVAVITEYMERDSVQERYNGLTDMLKSSGKNIQIRNIQRQKGDFSLNLFVGKALAEGCRYVAALDKFCTQEAAKAWASNRAAYEQKGLEEVRVYGIGNTAQTVSDLDNGNLCALVYQNEFNMGYEGIRALVEKEKKGYISEDFQIKYKLVVKETMYQEENERLLFPSI